MMQENAPIIFPEHTEDDSSSVDSDEDNSGDLTSYSSVNGSQTATENNGPSEARKHQKEIQHLVEKETRSVNAWRALVATAMVIIGACACVLTYFFLSNQEELAFSNGFQDIGVRMQLAVEQRMLNLDASFDGLHDVISSFGHGTWPLATIPDFHAHSDHLRDVTGATAVWWAPLLSLREKPAWETHVQTLPHVTEIYPSIYEIHNRTVEEAEGNVFFCPVAQIDPASQDLQVVHSPVNYDLLSDRFVKDLIHTSHGSAHHVILSDFAEMDFFRKALGYDENDPASLIVVPIFREPNNVGGTVGFLQGMISWATLFSGILTDESEATYCVLKSKCEGESESKYFTYYISGPNATLLGEGDLYGDEYESEEIVTVLKVGGEKREDRSDGCYYVANLYPSREMHDSYITQKPALFASIAAAVFLLMVSAFVAFALFVQRRNDKVVAAAARTTAIVSEMFPGTLRDRLLGNQEEKPKSTWHTPKTGIKNFLDDGNGETGVMQDSKPLADLFPETTIMFADLVGFTAWSSVRDPCQVFTLLETIFSSFDEIAKRRRIFKVETVGDCYVAVAGLPEPRRDHATTVAKFASECLRKVHELTKKLEVTLGPDTGDLTVRIGLHSGPVTAGVLRGERARFQLFGDTMNVAARMEHNGVPDKIQCSQDTADLLVAAGKSHWVTAREDVINAKGKGEMNTFWIKPGSKGASSRGSSQSVQSSNMSSSGAEEHLDGDDDYNLDPATKRLIDRKTARLVDWNVEILTRILKQVVVQYGNRDSSSITAPVGSIPRAPGATVLDEVKEIIVLPEFDADANRSKAETAAGYDAVELPENVSEQLRQYVSSIAALYLDNPFHNFEHASHVAMSVTKLLGRVVAPSDVLNKHDLANVDASELASTLHEYTYGITSDPLTQFACAFSALVHDVDHQGVPNSRLVEENTYLAAQYKGKSVAEQNSIDLAWELLMDSNYKDLRAALLPTQAKFTRFRQLVVNIVLATDIMDTDLKTLRNARWEKAFDTSRLVEENASDRVNRKATIVIEHMIQASDIAHTMQHWNIYCKWNERLFMEMYKAFKEGRSTTDPSDVWYKGEIGFFDFYIIPLAKKLKECGVFGVSSDEYLNYAVKNRKEWEAKGQQVVAEMVQKVKDEV